MLSCTNSRFVFEGGLGSVCTIRLHRLYPIWKHHVFPSGLAKSDVPRRAMTDVQQSANILAMPFFLFATGADEQGEGVPSHRQRTRMDLRQEPC